MLRASRYAAAVTKEERGGRTAPRPGGLPGEGSPDEGLSASVGRELDRAVARFVAGHRIPGAVAGAVVDGTLAWTGAYGFVDLEAGARADERTLYRVASVTKTFTAAAIVQLRDEGRLRLDDPLAVHLPEFGGASNPFGPIEDVTIRRVLTHEAGLPVESPLFDWARGGYPTIHAIVGALDRVVLTVPPESAHKYSNLGYQLLGEVIARLCGATYEETVARRLLDPLGMASSTFRPSEAELARAAPGHEARTFSDRLAPAAERSKPTTADGGLYSTVADLARWIAAQDPPTASATERPVLGPRSLEEMHRPRRLLDPGWRRAQALAWQVARRGDDVFVGHSGGTFGYSSAVLFSPGDRVGVIVLSNGTAPVSGLAPELIEPVVTEVRAGRRLSPVLPDPVPEAYAPLLGLYSWEDVGELARVEWRDGRLAFVWAAGEGAPQTLEPTDRPLAFVVRGGRETGEPCVFRRGADGSIVGLTIRGWPLARLVAAR
jgi:CubicO group peptidase (beta-lactamase class C family)